MILQIQWVSLTWVCIWKFPKASCLRLHSFRERFAFLSFWVPWRRQMAVTAKKTQKTRSAEKIQSQQRLALLISVNPRTHGAPQNIHRWWLCESLCDSQLDDRYKTETWIIYCPGQKDLKELSHPPYEWYIKLGIRRHPFLLLEVDWFSLFVCLPRHTEPQISLWFR